MKLLQIVLLFLLVSPSVGAVEFRGLNIGDSCSNILKNEMNIGGRPRDTWRIEDGEYLYEGFVLGYEAIITYKCTDNIFIKGSYIINSSGTKNASEIFFQLRSHFTAILGKVTFDSSSQDAREGMEKLGLTDIIKAKETVIQWDTSDQITHLSLNDSADGKPIIMLLTYKK